MLDPFQNWSSRPFATQENASGSTASAVSDIAVATVHTMKGFVFPPECNCKKHFLQAVNEMVILQPQYLLWVSCSNEKIWKGGSPMYHRYLEVNKRRLPGGYHPSTAMPDLVLMSEGQVNRFVGFEPPVGCCMFLILWAPSRQNSVFLDCFSCKDLSCECKEQWPVRDCSRTLNSHLSRLRLKLKCKSSLFFTISWVLSSKHGVAPSARQRQSQHQAWDLYSFCA